MKSSQLVTALKALSLEELLRFQSFLHSAFFHKVKLKPDLLHLFDYLYQGLAQNKAGYYEKVTVYKVLYPGQKIIKGKLSKLTSQLYAQLKAFFIFQKMEQRVGEELQSLYLMDSFLERQLDFPFKQLYNKVRRNADTEKVRWETNSFYTNYLTHSHISHYQSLFNNRKNDLNLVNTHFKLDLYYLIKKFEYAIQLLARKQYVYAIDTRESLTILDSLIPVLSARHLAVPLVQLFLAAYQLMQYFYQQEGEQHHVNFNQLLDQYMDNITYEQQKMFQTLNRSFIINKYQSGDSFRLKQLFALYQVHLRKGFLYEGGKILPGVLSNVTQIGLRNKANKWVYEFLMEHRNRISETETPEIVFQYNLSQYYFYSQDYEKALDHIAHTYDDQFYKISARRLELKIFYEMDSSIFDAKLKAFKLFIYRQTETSAHAKNKNNHQNFVDLLKQIRHSKTYKNQSRIKKLLDKIKGVQELPDKEWLIQKLEALQ